MAQKMRKVKHTKMSIAMKQAWQRRKAWEAKREDKQPETIHMIVDGKTLRYVLRTITVYMPADQLTPED